MAAVGKKKKGKKRKVVYVKKSKSNLLPVLVVAGVGAFLLFGNKAAAVVTPVITDPVPGPIDTGIPAGGSSSTPGDVQVYHGTEVIPITSLTNDAQSNNYLRSLQGIFPTSAPYWSAWQRKSAQDLSELWSLTTYFPASDTVHWTAFTNMTSAELAYVWWYVSGYLSKEKPVLSATMKLPNGQWDNTNPGNPELYAAMQSIHNKYGIF